MNAAAVIDNAATTANTIRGAAANAGNLERDNAQRQAAGAPTTSATDVWTHTMAPDDLARPMTMGEQVVQAVPVGGAVVTTIRGLAEGVALQGPSAVATSMSQQASQIADDFGKIGEAEGAMQTVGATFALLTSVEQMLSAPLSMIPFPAFPALRITDTDIGLPHAHNHPPNLIPPNPVPIPLPSTGPVIPIPFVSGANKTLINGLPAARCGDMGLGIWCGGFVPMFEVFLGSSSVWVEGSRAARTLVDVTNHCIFSARKGPDDKPLGPFVGTTVTGSPNVLIGGVPMPSLTSLAVGAAFKGLFSAAGKAIKAIRKWRANRMVEVIKEFEDEVTNVTPRMAPPPHVPLSPWQRALVESLHTPGMRKAVKEISVEDLAAITKATRDEWAVVMAKDGNLTVVRGKPASTAIKQSDILLAHTHPRGTPTPSPEDIAQAAKPKQLATYYDQAIVTPDGNVHYYNEHGALPSDRANKPHEADGVFR